MSKRKVLQMNPKVDEYLAKTKKWGAELEQLRAIVLDCGLIEEFKWKHPCYTLNQKNIVMLGEFKDFCILSFIKGTLLKDESNLLSSAGENTQSGKWMRFTNVKDIIANEAIIKSYIFEAIEVEKAGLKIEYKAVAEYEIPEELQQKMDSDASFKTAFNSMTPGRQKGYLLHFAQASQSKTRIARIEKYTDRILNGKGITDCVCGLSKRMPNCDGSHKFAVK